MASLEELVLPVRQSSRQAFAEAHPHPFLLRRADGDKSEEQWSFKTQTLSTTQANVARMLTAEGLTLSPEVSRYELFRVTKTQSNPWRDRISVGRARNNDIVIIDNSVSKLHAHFIVEPHGISVMDAGSRNGTSVGAEKLSSGQGRALQSGEVVTFGRVEMLFLDAPGIYDFVSRHIQQRGSET